VPQPHYAVTDTPPLIRSIASGCVHVMPVVRAYLIRIAFLLLP